MILADIIETYPDISFMSVAGFDDAIIGVEPNKMALVYDRKKMIDIMMSKGDTWSEAVEYLEYNVWYNQIGDNQPIFIDI
jgi:hypothetical protein